MKKVVGLAGLFLLVVALGCNRNDKKSEDVILHAYRLIDDQRTDEAIDLLEQCQRDQPAHQECKIVLASAFAHKAGIKIQKFVSLVNDVNRIHKLRESIQRAARPEEKQKDEKDGKNDEEKQKKQIYDVAPLIGAIQFLNQTSLALTLFSDIPDVAIDDRYYLEHSIALLEELGGRRARHATVYKVLLEIILLKHLLANDLFGPIESSSANFTANCELDFEKLNGNTRKIANLVIDISNDLSNINPRQSKELGSMALDVKSLVERLSEFLLTASIFDQLTKVILEEAVIGVGLGRLLKCQN